MNAKQKEQQEAVRELRNLLKPGDTVFVSLKHVSRSGMSRVIMPFIIRNNEPRYLAWTVAKATGRTYNYNHDGVIVGGCGMDMGFELVYTLSRYLFPDGFQIEGRGRNGETSGWDKDGGYALNHRWF
jgi:hypothetical protein